MSDSVANELLYVIALPLPVCEYVSLWNESTNEMPADARVARPDDQRREKTEFARPISEVHRESLLKDVSLFRDFAECMPNWERTFYYIHALSTPRVTFAERCGHNPAMSSATSAKPRILTGDTPTGRLHLGHYVGSIENRLALQDQYECYFLIANKHAFTTRADKPEEIRQSVIDIATDWLAVGIDPQQSDDGAAIRSAGDR